MPSYQIAGVKYMNKNFQLHGTMALLKWLLQLFSLDSAEKRINKTQKRQYIFKCVVSALIIGAADVYSLIWKGNNMFSSLSPSIVFTDVVQMSYDYVQYIVDLFFIYKYGREVSQEYFKNYKSIDNILDITHHEAIERKLQKLTSMLLLCWLIVTAFDFAAWWLGYGISAPIFYGLSYFFLLFKILTNLDLTVQVLNIECRLQVIGDLLQDCYNSTESLPIGGAKDRLTDSICNKNWFYGEGCVRAEKMKSRNHPLRNPSTNNYHVMKWLTRCYLLISEQCTFIDKMFGIRILLNSLSLLIDMVRFLNIVVRVSVGLTKTTHHENSGYLPAISTFLRFLICVFILISLVYHCELAYAQTDRIISVTDHILINKKPDNDLKESLTELRNLAGSRPISFNMANFFQLGYSFLVSMASVVVTYTIILLQSV